MKLSFIIYIPVTTMMMMTMLKQASAFSILTSSSSSPTPSSLMTLYASSESKMSSSSSLSLSYSSSCSKRRTFMNNFMSGMIMSFGIVEKSYAAADDNNNGIVDDLAMPTEDEQAKAVSRILCILFVCLFYVIVSCFYTTILVCLLSIKKNKRNPFLNSTFSQGEFSTSLPFESSLVFPINILE